MFPVSLPWIIYRTYLIVSSFENLETNTHRPESVLFRRLFSVEQLHFHLDKEVSNLKHDHGPALVESVQMSRQGEMASVKTS